jgi:hypothetical protein
LAVAVIARSVAIVSAIGTHEQWDRMRALVRKLFGDAFEVVLIGAIADTHAKRFRPACKAIMRLMQFDSEQTEQREPEGGKEKGADSTSAPAPKPPMVIIELDRTERTTSFARGIRSARSGSRINSHRLARAVVSGSAGGLFRRRRKIKGGALLIDASGSMDLCAETLMRICQHAPAATIAYYSSRGPEYGDQCRGVYGALKVWARDGKRANCCPHCGGNNSVDLWALRWLLEQPGPRVIVTDRGFCGGPADQAERAHILLGRAEATREVLVIDTVEDALAYFGART